MRAIKPRVFITRKPPIHVLEDLKEYFDVDTWDFEESNVPREHLLTDIEKYDGLLCLLTENVDEEVLSKGESLKVVSNLAVGFNNIDVALATQKGVMVTNTPGVLTETTADLTFALLMATSRRIIEASAILREGQWKTWSPMFLTGMDIHGSTLGIIGLGDIGAAVARRAKGFNLNLLYHNRSRKENLESELGIEYRDLPGLLKESDFVVILTPFTKETENLITINEFKLMKKTAILINTARGGIVNEEDLAKALSDGLIWGAGLDVFVEEPVPLNHPLLRLPNVVTLPHIGSASIQTRTKMWELAAKNLKEALLGNMPPNLVNKEILANK